MEKSFEYQLALEQVDKLVVRRQTASSTFLTVNTAIIGAIAFLARDYGLQGTGAQLAALVLFVAAIGSTHLWRGLIRQHNISLTWWYAQLRKLEEELPCTKLISREYSDLYDPKTSRAKKQIGMLTPYEVYLTWFFTGVYAVFTIVVVYMFFSSWVQSLF